MIIDCFLFSEDFLALEIRLNELYEVVDQFIICESSFSFSGIKKKLFLTENLEKIKNFKPDLIISDWMMPGKSGIELVQELRRNNKLKEVPFLMISCNSGIHDISMAYSSGVDDYLVKPFRIPDLKKSIQRLLRIE